MLDVSALTVGWPKEITVDNGTEFASRRFDNWAHARGIRLDFIRPGKPVENGYTRPLTTFTS